MSKMAGEFMPEKQAQSSEYGAAFQELVQRTNTLVEMLASLENRLGIALNPPGEKPSSDKAPGRLAPMLVSGVIVLTDKINGCVDKVSDINARLVL